MVCCGGDCVVVIVVLVEGCDVFDGFFGDGFVGWGEIVVVGVG